MFKKKTFRYYYWFTVEYTKKHLRLILLSCLMSFFVLVSLISFSPFLQSFLSSRQNTIGLVGEYTFQNPPEEVTNKVSHGLVFINEKGEILPALASTWEVINEGREYRFHLKQDLFWNDGKALRAQDIQYDFKDVETSVINSNTIHFKLKKALPIFPTYLTRPVLKYPLTGVVGLYKVDKVKAKYGMLTEVSLTPNKKDLPHLTYKFYDTESKLINAFKRGEIREMRTSKKSLAQPFEDWKNTTVTREVDYSRVLTLFFNLQNPSLAEKDIRKAIHLAIPQINFKDYGEDANSPIPPTSWAHNTNLKRVLYDKDAAEETLRPAFEGSNSAELRFMTFYDYIDSATVIKDSLEDVGVKSNLKLNATQSPNDFDMLLAYWKVPVDPDQYFFWHSTQTAGNITHYRNVRIDKLLEDGRNTLEVKERSAIYDDFQRVMVDEVPAIFLYYPYTYTIRRK